MKEEYIYIYIYCGQNTELNMLKDVILVELYALLQIIKILASVRLVLMNIYLQNPKQ
jgi:hypothetical protein